MLLRSIYLRSRPYIKNSVQIATIYAFGDFTQQKLLSKVKEYNYTSTRNVTIVGGCVLAPFYVTWYGLLARKFPGTTTLVILKKIACDQFVAGALGTCVFFIVMSFLERKENIFKECREKAPTAYLCNTLYFPVVMYGVFKKVPLPLQPVAVACADFFWSIFLCYYKMQDIHTGETRPAICSSISTPIDSALVVTNEE